MLTCLESYSLVIVTFTASCYENWGKKSRTFFYLPFIMCVEGMQDTWQWKLSFYSRSVHLKILLRFVALIPQSLSIYLNLSSWLGWWMKWESGSHCLLCYRNCCVGRYLYGTMDMKCYYRWKGKYSLNQNEGSWN